MMIVNRARAPTQFPVIPRCERSGVFSRHPEEPRSGVSKDARPGWWPSILRGSLRSRLRMTVLPDQPDDATV
ncbi:hypothetical protein ACVMB0_006912 [Bradyrhizobium sp. USDA 4451]